MNQKSGQLGWIAQIEYGPRLYVSHCICVTANNPTAMFATATDNCHSLARYYIEVWLLCLCSTAFILLFIFRVRSVVLGSEQKMYTNTRTDTLRHTYVRIYLNLLAPPCESGCMHISYVRCCTRRRRHKHSKCYTPRYNGVLFTAFVLATQSVSVRAALAVVTFQHKHKHMLVVGALFGNNRYIHST